VRIIGYAAYDSGLATPGAWGSGPTKIQLFGPGIKKPGDIVQVAPVISTTTSGTTSSTSSFAALSSGISAPISPSSYENLIEIELNGNVYTPNGTSSGLIQIARSTTLIGNPLGTDSMGASGSIPLYIFLYDLPATLSSTTYSAYGKSSSGTISFPHGGSGASLRLIEIMG
jgi:hypothetical protein